VTTKATTQKASPKASPKVTGAETDEAARGRKIEVVGEVISDKMDKTISVLIYRTLKHAKYGKYMKRSSVFKAHDEKEIAKIGDVVRIRETRPLSKTKRWKLVEVVETAKN
jgi:small subunit ribosomal protein S17